MEEETTHFGYQQVPRDEKVKKVGAVFDSVASHYDLMNGALPTTRRVGPEERPREWSHRGHRPQMPRPA